MRIGLELTKYCIETASRKAYERLIRKLMKRQCADQMLIEAQLEILQYFLENADFSYLRSEYKILGGIDPVRITLEVQGDPKHLIILVGDQKIQPRWTTLS